MTMHSLQSLTLIHDVLFRSFFTYSVNYSVKYFSYIVQMVPTISHSLNGAFALLFWFLKT